MRPAQQLQGLSHKGMVWADDGDRWRKTLEVGSVWWCPSDSIPHAKLLACVEWRIADGAVLKLIGQWLRAPIMEEPKDRLLAAA